MEHHFRLQLHDSVTGRIVHRDLFTTSTASGLPELVAEEYPNARLLGFYEIQ